MEIKSISRGAAEFQRYLLGHKEDDFRALPIRSLNVGTDQEMITYRIVKKNQIHRPPFYYLALLKPRVLLVALLPLFFLLKMFLHTHSPLPLSSTIGAALGVLFGVLAGSLKNDFTDYISGLDRLLPEELQRPIQKGWATPWKVLRISQVLLVLSLLCAIPVVLQFPNILFILALGGTMALWTQVRNQDDFKFSLRGEFAISFLFGPILSLGFWNALSGETYRAPVFAFGLMWGLFVHFLIHLQNFSNAMLASQFKLKNTMTRLGFDRSRWFLPSWFFLCLIVYMIFEIYFGSVFFAEVGAALFIPPLIYFSNLLRKLKSPLSSGYLRASQTGYTLLLLFEFYLFARSFF